MMRVMVRCSFSDGGRDAYEAGHGEMYFVSPTGEWAKRLPKECVMLINARGLHILDATDKEHDNCTGQECDFKDITEPSFEWITTIPYQDIVRYGSSTHRLAIFVSMEEGSSEHKIEFVVKQDGRASEIVMLARAYAIQMMEVTS